MNQQFKKVIISDKPKKTIGLFEKYLTVWVALGILAGIVIGHFVGDGIEVISSLEIARVNIPVAILIWLMIYPHDVAGRFFDHQKNWQKAQGGCMDTHHQLGH